MLDFDEILRAVLIGTALAVIAAILGTFVVFAAWRWIVRWSSMRILAALLAVVGLAAVYVAAAAMLMFISNWLPNQPVEQGEQIYVTTSYIHPGVLFKAAPALALFVTWILLSLRRSRSARAAA